MIGSAKLVGTKPGGQIPGDKARGTKPGGSNPSSISTVK